MSRGIDFIGCLAAEIGYAIAHIGSLIGNLLLQPRCRPGRTVAIAKTLSCVEDEELRAALARLGASIKRN